MPAAIHLFLIACCRLFAGRQPSAVVGSRSHVAGRLSFFVCCLLSVACCLSFRKLLRELCGPVDSLSAGLRDLLCPGIPPAETSASPFLLKYIYYLSKNDNYFLHFCFFILLLPTMAVRQERVMRSVIVLRFHVCTRCFRNSINIGVKNNVKKYTTLYCIIHIFAISLCSQIENKIKKI